MISWFINNLKIILSKWYKFVTFLTFMGGLVIPSSYISDNPFIRIGVSLIIGALSFLGTAFYVYRKNEAIIWEKGTGKIEATYGDLFEIAKGASVTDDGERFVVIPVNTAFDTIVDDTGDYKKPLVSKNTLHGRWLTQCNDYGLTVDEIDNQISDWLKDIKPERLISKELKTRGNLVEYPTGTIVPVKGKYGTTFLLAALSTFNENNNAYAGRTEVKRTIESIISYCDQRGQQKPVYIPVMGTGLSRANLLNEEAFRLTKYVLLCFTNCIHEKMTIVVYKKLKESVAIF